MAPERGAQSQASDNATQEISQSALELVRSRSEQISLEHDARALDDEPEAGDTLEDTPQEGDSNFLDIVSSFTGPPVEQESVPLNLSPSQSQPPLTQFPESQRFKTPATAGKKRDYNGNVVDTPKVSRNPFARDGQQTPAHGLGLSQAFAQTQAASSPFVNVVTSVLRSDRPSPSLEVEKHVVHLPTSSPLHPLSEFKRAATEPADRYVPAGHSQLLRTGSVDGLDPDADPNTATQVIDYDGFESGASTLDRQRRARLREARAREQLKTVSSPISPDMHNPPPERRAEPERLARTRSTSTDSLPSSPPAVNHTEEGCEGDHGVENVPTHVVAEDNTELLQSEARGRTRTSQMPGEHGKAPATVIPDTTKRHGKMVAQSFPPTQPSPTARQTRSSRTITNQKLVSSGPVRVANSQRSARSTQDSTRRFPGTSSADSIEMVPASPEGELVATEPSYTPRLQTSGSQRASHEDEIDVQADGRDQISAHEQRSRDGPPTSTVPETSSGRGQSDVQRYSTYATAPDNQASNPKSPSPGLSRQPVLPPLDRKRKRMEDISQDDVVPQGTQSSSFDADKVLDIDENPDVAQALASTQDEDPIVPRKRPRTNYGSGVSPLEIEETRSPSNGINANIGRRVSIRNTELAGEDGENNAPQNHDDDLPELQAKEAVAKTPTKLPRKRSAWDMNDSPKPRHAPKILGPRSQPVTNIQHKATRRVRHSASKSVAKTPTALPSIEEASPDPLATSLTSTAPPTPQANPDRVIAPNMVFAYFMGRTRAYYPAICLEALSDKQQHRIEWPGYDPEDVGDHGICSLDLRVGDVVKVAMEKYPKGAYIIHGFCSEPGDTTSSNHITDIYGHSHVVVEHKNSKVSFPKGVDKNQPIAIADIYIDLNTWNRVRKRPFVYEAPEAINNTSGISTPLNRGSTPTTPSSRGRHAEKDLLQPSHHDGMFANMVFALSFEDNNTKSQISEMVTQNGGLVLGSSFRELFDDDLNLKSRFKNIGFAALLADRHSRKEKYMQALAFRLPCLSGKWIEAAIKKSSLADWQDYLLPAGESAELDGAVRSRVLPHLEARTVKLGDMVRQRTQFFNRSAAIFVQGRGKAEKRTPHLTLVQIMGAEGVDKVADLTAAKERLRQTEKTRLTWLFVADKDYAEACRLVKDVKKEFDDKSKKKSPASWECEVADNEFVMQSLIMGRLYSRG